MDLLLGRIFFCHFVTAGALDLRRDMLFMRVLWMAYLVGLYTDLDWVLINPKLISYGVGSCCVQNVKHIHLKRKNNVIVCSELYLLPMLTINTCLCDYISSVVQIRTCLNNSPQCQSCYNFPQLPSTAAENPRLDCTKEVIYRLIDCTLWHCHGCSHHIVSYTAAWIYLFFYQFRQYPLGPHRERERQLNVMVQTANVRTKHLLLWKKWKLNS